MLVLWIVGGKTRIKKWTKGNPFTKAQKGCAMERASFRDCCSYHATPTESIFYGVNPILERPTTDEAYVPERSDHFRAIEN